VRDGFLVRINLESPSRGSAALLREMVESIETDYEVTIVEALGGNIGDKIATVEFCAMKKGKP
jgi:hypothetical protein